MITNLLQYLDRTAVKYPQILAVIDGEREISISELTENAKKLSSIIFQKTNGILRKPIAIYLEKQIEAVIADIGIIYSGNAYMNLDIKTPIQRIDSILKLIQPEVVITNNKHFSELNEIWPEEKILNIDLIEFENIYYSQIEIDKILNKIIDTDPLCIINTSGSTGVPKGVVLNHRSFIDFTEWSIEFTGISDNEIMGSLSPLVFDIYSFELCLLIAKGCTIMIIPEGLSAYPVRILQLLQQHQVTYIFWVPTIMVNIANMELLTKISISSLKSIWFAGEVFPTKQFNYWRKCLPNSTFINLYGPIEITLDCTYYIVDRQLSDDEPIPIGIACKNTDILILNDDNQICNIDEEGELCVRGSSLAMGYYNNHEKTAAAFVQNPLNDAYPEIIYRTGDIALTNDRDEIIFKGRKDTLIKHSGYRIELSEIEHIIINSLHLVKNGCAVYNYTKKEIVFYYESKDNLTVPEMKRIIGKLLPKYMIPTKFIQMTELPRNVNGKIDRLKLKEML